MVQEIFRYCFKTHVALKDVEATLLLALYAAENLFGESLVRLETGHWLDQRRRVLILDASTEVGRCLNRLFVGFLRREFGGDAFLVERVEGELPSVAHA